MTIFIDDAGWGDLLLGVVIGAYRDDTDQFAYHMVDISFFRDPNFDMQRYLPEVSRIVQELLKELKATKDLEIRLCTGYVLSTAYGDLKREGYNVSTGRITGKPQQLGEQAYLNELRKIGYEPLPNREDDRRMRVKSFYHMLKWLREKSDRLQYAKTGWRFFTGKPKRQPPWRRDYEDY